ncbi:MAG TPA: hypothetical protein VE860_11275, partial [Chthoniobacterales bacterium]|nr:hypothetical protein [Chthoniobacterales bacterium]
MFNTLWEKILSNPTMVPTVILMPRIHGLPPMISGFRVILSSSGNCMAYDLKLGKKKSKVCWGETREYGQYPSL